MLHTSVAVNFIDP